MRHIVIEGVDASGKSTLAREFQRTFNWDIQPSEGPPKYPGEMNRRLARYARYPLSHIFDRHPVVSQEIYGTMRTHSDDIDEIYLKHFYESDPVLIYCDPLNRGMQSHTRSTIDTDHHLDQVSEHYPLLLTLYRDWAIKHAHLIYRIGDKTRPLINAVKGMLYAYL